ncbi:MAG: glycoside hydrolase family 25 protein [Terrimicrobiaceae bacterium]
MATFCDVSLWQGRINFTTMRAKAEGVFVKASEANFADSRFAINWQGAKQAGLKRGAYHFYRVNADAGVQVRTFIEAMAGDWGELPPVVDVEDVNHAVPWTAQQVKDLKWFIDVLDRFTGVKPMIYTGAWYWDPYLKLANWANQYDLWAANYVPAPTGTPVLPAAWSVYRYWQWTSSADGVSFGVSSDKVDLSVEAGDVPAPAPVYPVITFGAAKNSITAGDSTDLIWSVEQIEGVWLDGRGVAGVARESVRPATTTTYTLKVQFRDLTTTTRTVTVTVTPAPEPIPTPVVHTRLGVNIIGGNDQVIQHWIDAGCKRFHITFNPDAAVQLKRAHPEFDVSHRALFYGGHLPSLQEFQDKHGYCLDKANDVRVYGLNENDQIGAGGADGSQPDQIRQRAEWDGQMWQWCESRGVDFVGGGFAMGTPNIVVPAIRKAMRDYYAPLFNAGMKFNQHMYSGNDHSGTPIKSRIFALNENVITWDGVSAKARQTWWLEERPRFYVAFCGFDCSHSTFECDETGVDNPGPFNDFGFSEAEKAAWAAEWCRRNSEFMPDGKPYRVTSGTLFADGDYNRWKAFADSIRPASMWRGVY